MCWQCMQHRSSLHICSSCMSWASIIMWVRVYIVHMHILLQSCMTLCTWLPCSEIYIRHARHYSKYACDTNACWTKRAVQYMCVRSSVLIDSLLYTAYRTCITWIHSSIDLQIWSRLSTIECKACIFIPKGPWLHLDAIDWPHDVRDTRQWELRNAVLI